MTLRSTLASVVLVIAGMAALLVTTSARAQQVVLTHEQVATEIAPAVPLIRTPYAHGSGVLISPRLVVTNAHVVYPFDAADVIFPGGAWAPEVKVIAWDLTADMVVLELPADAPVDPLAVVSSAGLPIGTAVYAIGYPGQPDGTAPLTVLDGLINGSRSWSAIGVDYVQTDIPVIGGMSGGAVVTGAGELISFNEWSLAGQMSVGPSAVDVIARLEAQIAGEDVNRLGTRYPEVLGQKVSVLEFELLDGRDEKVFITSPHVLGEVYVSLSTDAAAWVGAVWPDGTVIQSSSAEQSADHVLQFWNPGLGVPIYIIIDQLGAAPGRYILGSSVSLFALEDPDDRQVVTQSQIVPGHTDYPLDLDTFVVPLQAGQRLSVEVESLLIDQFAAVEFFKDGEIQVLAWDDDGGGGVWGLDPLVDFVAPETREYLLVIGGLLDQGVGGYIANIQITDPLSAINGTFSGSLPEIGIALTSWGGGPIGSLLIAAEASGCQLDEV